MPKDWNPDLYLKYGNERIQPAIDLVSRIKVNNPDSIIDIGCGPGNSTELLIKRWPESNICGMDNSPAMIEKAKKIFPEREWILMDAGNIRLDKKYDLIFSNAALQWIPQHDQLIKDLYNLCSDKGILAAQLPLFWDMPLGKSISYLSKQEPWKKFMKDESYKLIIHDAGFYYDCLSGLFSSVEIWESNYVHIMESQESILEMIKSTGLKPFLDQLKLENDKKKFEAEVLNEIRKDYPLQKNGKVLFPFRRIFFIAYK